MIPPTKRFDMFPLTGGCSEGLGAFRFFFEHKNSNIPLEKTKSFKIGDIIRRNMHLLPDSYEKKEMTRNDR